MLNNNKIYNKFDISRGIVLHQGDCIDLLKQIPDNSIQLLITSPPYNLGKEYERKLKLKDYIQQQESVILECVRVVRLLNLWDKF